MAKEERIGSPYKDLVFRTAGNIRVLVGDKYYTLGYNETKNSDRDEDSTKITEKDIIVASSIDDYRNGNIEYPGDKKIIFVPGDSIYYTLDNNYYSFSEVGSESNNSTTLSNIFDDTIYLNGNPPLVISNIGLIKGLNAQYLEGHSYYEFLKKDDRLDIDSISTSDGKFVVEDGKLTVDNIEATSIKTDVVSFNTVVGTINIGGGIAITEWNEWEGSKYIPYSYSVISDVYSLYNQGLIQTELSFLDLAKLLFTVENSTYNWELPSDNADLFLQELVTSEIIFKPQNIEEQWKSISLTSGGSLYNYFSKKIYFGDPLEGSVFRLTISDGTCVPGDIFNIEVYKGDDVVTREAPLTISSIVTYVGEGEICLSTNFTSQTLQEAQEVSEPYNISIIDEYGEELILYTTTISRYEFPDLEDPNYGYNLFEITSLSSKSGVIGNLSGITDSAFGELSGYGLYTGNAYLNNPKIVISNTNPYIKLTNLETSFLGKTSTGAPFLEILTDGQGVIRTHGFKLWPNGIFETAAIKIYSDGQVDIGDKSGDLIVEDDGTVKLIEHGKTNSSKSI